MVKEKGNENTMGCNIVVPQSDPYFYPLGVGETNFKFCVSTFKGRTTSEEDYYFFAKL